MQKTLFILSLLACSAFCLLNRNNELQILWNSWKDVHQKSYTPAEDAARFAIFVENYKVIIKHNAEHTSHKLGLNIFADLTLEEFGARLKYRGSNKQHAPEDILYVPEDEVIPTSVDWRKKKAVTPVQQEGQCGSCWAFSVTGVLEGMRAIKSKELKVLSAQQILDCLSTEEGCDGGELDAGLDYAAQYGLETATDYPYTGQDDTCKYDKNKAVHINTGHITVPSNDTNAFKSAIATMPTTMVIDAFAQAFQLYTSGVITNCTVTVEPNHSALAVGYGEMDGVDAYFIKNSWGTSWGDHGYVYLSTDAKQNDGSGACGILQMGIFIAK